MNVKTLKWLFILPIAFAACRGDDGYDQYKKLEKKELARGVRQDSIFLGIQFGMTSKQFYGYCWELNKKGVITDGASNTAVEYKLGEQLGKPAFMHFYPEFYENKVYRMKAVFRYNAWAPWAKELYADRLQPEVVKLLQKWHTGNPFLKISDPQKGVIYVKADGNRRITIGRYDDMHVKVDYTDLLVEKK